MENKMNQKSSMVRFYDGETKTYRLIPTSELTVDMILFKDKDSNEEPAWAHSSHFTLNDKFLHPEFSEDVKRRIRMIQADVAEVYYLTEKQWEDGFRKDANPMKEICHWIIVGDTYQDAVTNEFYTKEQKRELFKIIVSCGMGKDAEAIYYSVSPKSFSKEQAMMLISRSIARRDLMWELARKRSK